MSEAQPTLARLLYDARLTETARIIGLHVALQASPEEPIAIPYDDFARILNGAPSGDTIARHVRLLEVHGYVKKGPGGRGSPVFEWVGPLSTPDICGLKEELRSAHLRTKGLHRTPADHTASLGRTPADQSAPVVVDDKEVVGVVGERAREQSQDERLKGCRDALRDYLAGSVPPARQYQYVQTLIGWLGGTDASVWKKPDGSNVDPGRRTELLAAGLNELGASDEAMMKRPVGDPANLKTKMNVILRQAHQPSRDSGGRNSQRTKDPSKPKDPKAWRRGAVDGSHL